MSFTPAIEPLSSKPSTSTIATIIEARPREVAGFSLRRLLPSRARRLIGPFIYLDHMGPVEFTPGAGVDVPPHPHIGLATITYLFDGELIHRDSLGSYQSIRPSEINWMTAGRGIVHSERTGPELRRTGSTLHALQIWVALLQAFEESEPAFHHYAGADVPEFQKDSARIRVLVGNAFGIESKVQTFSPTLLLDVAMGPQHELSIPEGYEEQACYVVAGTVNCGAERVEAGRMLVFASGIRPVLRAETAVRLVLLGGAPMDGPRHIWWNFVSSSQERIEQAKLNWKQRRFPKVPGDENEYATLPSFS